jgi:hypothetical protein
MGIEAVDCWHHFANPGRQKMRNPVWHFSREKFRHNISTVRWCDKCGATLGYLALHASENGGERLQSLTVWWNQSRDVNRGSCFSEARGIISKWNLNSAFTFLFWKWQRGAGAVIINATNCRVHERKESDEQVTFVTSFTRVWLRFVEKNYPNFLVSGNFIDRGTRRRERPKGRPN